MWRKRGLSLNHIAETFFASETFVKKAAFRLNENKTRAVSDPPKRKSKKQKISAYLPTLPVFPGVSKFFMKSRAGNYLPWLFYISYSLIS